MSTRAVCLGLAVTAFAGAAGCGSSGHTTAHKAAPGSATSAAASSELQGKIVFRRFLDDAHSHGALFVMNANGTGIRGITHPPVDAVDSLNGPPSATPDAATLVFDRSTPNAAGIFRVGLDGRGEREVPAPGGVPGDGWPAVSPAGTWIAVARAWGHKDKFEDLKTGLYVLGIHGGHPRLVANFGYRADVGGATWSPDSKTIVFSAHNNGPGKPSGASALFAVRADGSGGRTSNCSISFCAIWRRPARSMRKPSACGACAWRPSARFSSTLSGRQSARRRGSSGRWATPARRAAAGSP